MKSIAQGKVVLITGASAGIGLEMAVYLAELGYRVVATMRDLSRRMDLQKRLEEQDLTVDFEQCDVSLDLSMVTCVNKVMAKYGMIDVLINNAGYGLFSPLEVASTTKIRAQMETNFFGLVRMCQLVLPAMRKARSGSLINVSSIAGRIAFPTMGYYTASKFAVEGFSEALYHEVKPFNVNVVLIEPGRFETQFSVRGVEREEVEPGHEYYPIVSRMDRRNKPFKIKAANPLKVAKLVDHVIRSSSPRLRYFVGFDAKILWLFNVLAPRRLYNFMIGQLFHTNRLGKI